MPKTLAAWGLALAATVSQEAAAANWQICDLQVWVHAQQPSPRSLYVEVLHAKPKGEAQCPTPGSWMAFTPSTMDYQSELPRRRWPQPGKVAAVRHRYLDAVCKNVGACRIQYYSPMGR